MVEKCKICARSRPYANFTSEALDQALVDIRKGVSQTEASGRYEISCSTVGNKLFGKLLGDVGYPTILNPEDEQIIIGALS